MKSRAKKFLVDLIALFLPWIIRRSLRSKLHGIYARGAWAALPEGGFILAANHHSWWDPYLGWFVGQRLGRNVTGVMLEATLERFPFFRSLGAVGQREVREALRRLGRGGVLIIFPEGELRPPGKVERIERGVRFLAEKTQLPVFPLALRVTVRGTQHPEAFLSLGEAVATGAPDQLETQLKEALDELLEGLEVASRAADPEAPPPGFEPWLSGARSTHERAAWIGRLFG